MRLPPGRNRTAAMADRTSKPACRVYTSAVWRRGPARRPRPERLGCRICGGAGRWKYITCAGCRTAAPRSTWPNGSDACAGGPDRSSSRRRDDVAVESHPSCGASSRGTAATLALRPSRVSSRPTGWTGQLRTDGGVRPDTDRIDDDHVPANEHGLARRRGARSRRGAGWR